MIDGACFADLVVLFGHYLIVCLIVVCCVVFVFMIVCVR